MNNVIFVSALWNGNELSWLVNFSQKKATFTMLYHGFCQFYKVRKKCGVRWSRTLQMSAPCGVRDRTLKTSVRRAGVH